MATRRPSIKSLAVILGLAGGLILAELGALIWVKFVLPLTDPAAARELSIVDHNENRWQGHPYANYMPRPGFKVVNENGEVVSQHNSLGFRGPEIPIKKPDGVFRIVLLGGSAAYSSRVLEDDKMITTHLAEALGQKGFPEVEVINAAASAYSTAEALITLQFRVLELSPDLVILYEAVNDLHNRYVPPELFHADNTARLRQWRGQEFPWWARSYLARLIGYRKGWLRDNLFLDYYIAAPTYLGHTSEKTDVDFKDILQRNTPRFFRENLVSMNAICKARGIGFMVASYAWSPERHELGYMETKGYAGGLKEMNDTLREFAAKEKTPFFDYAAVMPKDAELWRDEIHVSPLGAAKTAQLFADFIVANRLVRK